MAGYVRKRQRMGPVGWIIVVFGILLLPLITLFLVNTMFGTSIPFTTDTYLLTFVIYVVVFFVLGLFLMAAGRFR